MQPAATGRAPVPDKHMISKPTKAAARPDAEGASAVDA